MTDIYVRNETRHNSRVRRDTERLLEAAAGPVKEVTDLPLASLTIRLMTPVNWQREVMAYAERSLQPRCGTSAPETSKHQALLQLERWRTYAKDWKKRPGITVTTADGIPQTLIVPRALQLTGVTRVRHGLHRFMAQEAARQAQINASRGGAAPGALWTPRHRQARIIVTAHAVWAQQQVSTGLYGTPLAGLPEHPPRSSGRERYIRALPAETRPPLTEPTQKWPGTSAAAIAFVAATIEAAGKERWNRTIWGDLNRAPTDELLQEPDVWLRRVGLVTNQAQDS